MNLTLIKSLRIWTGAGMKDCKRALEKANGNIDVAQEFLKLKSQAFSRRKLVNGQLVPWDDDDYLREAIKEAQA